MIPTRELPIPVIGLDAERHITSANEAAAELLGYKPDELVGNSCDALLRPRKPTGEDLSLDEWKQAAKFRASKRLNEQDLVLRRADGSEVQVLIDGGYERDDDGRFLGATVLLRARHRGARRPSSGVRIVSAVSHELRSPLTSVRGYTSLLLKRWDSIADDDRKSMLNQIDRDARRISRMIGELLDISRIESGRVQLNRTEVDVSHLAARVIESVKIAYPDLDASTNFPVELPAVWVDSDKVEQVLTNLIENACKYASPKGIVVRGSVRENEIVVEVVDRGPGIPLADLPGLFRQFFKSSEGRPSGTGLGLWISRGLIEAHGGELTADSDVESGSIFRFTLPTQAFEALHEDVYRQTHREGQR